MPPCRTVVRRRYAFSVPFAGPDTPTVIAINSTAPGLSVSSVSRHPFTSHRAIQVNPQEPAPGPEDPAAATSRAQEGDESETPTRELEADSARPESAATSVSLCSHFSSTKLSSSIPSDPYRIGWTGKSRHSVSRNCQLSGGRRISSPSAGARRRFCTSCVSAYSSECLLLTSASITSLIVRPRPIRTK